MNSGCDFEELTAYVGWKEALLVLGVRRYRELLAETGVPTAIADDPETAVDAARQILRQFPETPSELEGRISELIRSIEEQYGEQAADELVRWAARQFVGSQSAVSLFAWSITLPSLAGAYDPEIRPNVQSPLDPEYTSRLNRIVRSRFSRRTSSESYQRLHEAALRYDLSGEELGWLGAESSDSEQNDDDADLGTRVGLLIAYEQAFRTWRELEAEFSIDQIAIIRDWAVREAIEIGWTEDDAVRLLRS